MIVDESFYEGEERIGYYIRPIMKRMWAVMMEVLSVVSDICERHDIRWFADSGTLLGAVRHNGFIPWDDDVDIAMLRADYDRFIRIAPYELPAGWKLFNGSQDSSPNSLITRVINTDTVCVEKEFLMHNHGCPYIMGVDIFVLDKVSENPEEDELYRALLTMLYDVFRKIDNNMTIKDCTCEIRQEVEEIQQALVVELNPDGQLKKQIAVLADQLSAIFNDSESKTLAQNPWYINRPEVRIPASCYDDTIIMPFETMMVRVPSGYDTVLRTWFGDDYMTPKHTGVHTSLEKSENLLRQYYEQRGMEFPKEFE